MKIGVPKERAPNEARVAIVPETVKRLVAKNLAVVVEAGAGLRAAVSDDEYRAAGAIVVPTAAEALAADLVIKVQPPTREEVARLREGAAVVSLLYPASNAELVQALAARRVTALAADLVPRTTLAQMMDVLSSQATIAGYRAVLLAAHALPKMLPMMMTAAGTIPPARVLVLGAGVAGLQALATARRLGAVVEAFDVRKVVKEQVESLGGKFVEVPSNEDAQTASGYAGEVSEEYKRKQAELVAAHVAKADVAITTALIPGKRAPTLITAEMVRRMRPGAVIVDIAADQGGNCELTKPGERVVAHGVTILGELNVPSQIPVHASQMYSRNMEKLVLHVVKEGTLRLDDKEGIARSMLATHAGEVVRTTPTAPAASPKAG